LGTDDGTTSGLGSNDIVIGATGSVSSMFASQHALYIRGSSNNFTNDGTVYSISSAARFQGDFTDVINTGLISSTASYGVYFQGVTAGGFSNLVNSGTISGHSFAVYAILDDLEVLNTGTIVSANSTAVHLGSDGYDLDLINHGIISTSGTTAVRSEDGNDTVVNHSSINGNVDLNDGTNSFTNTGDLTGSYVGGNGLDTVTNSGHITSAVHLSSGADFYFGTADGVVTGEIDLGTGNDTAILGNVGGIVQGDTGDDTITGGAGSDVIDGGDDNDLIRGRTGDDIIEGGSGNDTLRAGQGDDEVFGGSGDDFIRGGAGEDIINGGIGSDTMFGGSDGDSFVFVSALDSPDVAGRDVIQDFTVGDDIIDLSAFSGLSFIGDSGFSGSGAEVRVTDPNSIGRVKIYVDTDGDGTADMKIILNNTTTLSEDDFLF
jgi:Ca2+-binding RTX toxin-like protein